MQLGGLVGSGGIPYWVAGLGRATAGRACVVHACPMQCDGPPGSPQLTRGHLTSWTVCVCVLWWW